jgi:cyclophilin family peptidyl-prolyl cis-trans isomerase
MKTLLKTTLALTAAGFICSAFGATAIKTEVETKTKIVPSVKASVSAEIKKKKPPTKAIIETSEGTVTFEFLLDKAPKTCQNFIKLAKKGFYDNLSFHRVIDKFMIQGGCPNSKVDENGKLVGKGVPGTGGPGYMIDAEFNDTKHVPGIVSMARSRNVNSAGSQFFICVNTVPHLDKQYTAFGKVTKGYAVIEKIGKVKTNPGNNMPLKPVIIKKITVE